MVFFALASNNPVTQEINWYCSTPTGTQLWLTGAIIVFPADFPQPELCEWTTSWYGCDDLFALWPWRLFLCQRRKQNQDPVPFLWKPKALSGAQVPPPVAFYGKKNTDFVSDLNLQRGDSLALAFLSNQTVTTKETTKHLCPIKDVKYNR